MSAVPDYHADWPGQPPAADLAALLTAAGAAVAELAVGADLDQLADRDAAAAMGTLTTLVGQLDGLRVRLAREVRDREICGLRGARNLAGWLRADARLADDAWKLSRLAAMTPGLPRIAALLSSGEISLTQAATACWQISQLPETPVPPGSMHPPGPAGPGTPAGPAGPDAASGAADGGRNQDADDRGSDGDGAPGCHRPAGPDDGDGTAGADSAAGQGDGGSADGSPAGNGAGLPGGGAGGGDGWAGLWRAGDVHAAADELFAAFLPGLDGGQLRQMGAHLREAADSAEHAADARDDFARRGLRISRSLGGAGEISGRLHAEAAEAVIAAFEELGGKTGPDDNRSKAQRWADALARLTATTPSPGPGPGAGQQPAAAAGQPAPASPDGQAGPAPAAADAGPADDQPCDADSPSGHHHGHPHAPDARHGQHGRAGDAGPRRDAGRAHEPAAGQDHHGQADDPDTGHDHDGQATEPAAGHDSGHGHEPAAGHDSGHGHEPAAGHDGGHGHGPDAGHGHDGQATEPAAGHDDGHGHGPDAGHGHDGQATETAAGHDGGHGHGPAAGPGGRGDSQPGTGTRPGRPAGTAPAAYQRPRVIVTVPLSTLLGQPLAPGGTLGSGTPLTAESARRLTCDAEIIRLITSPAAPPGPPSPGHGGDATAQLTQLIAAAIAQLPPPLATPSALLDIGRASPGWTPRQRDALHAQYGGHCSAPRCGGPIDVIHHILHWLHGGKTRTINGAPFCLYHHWLVHEGGWHARKNPDATITLYPPPPGWRPGTIYRHGKPVTE